MDPSPTRSCPLCGKPAAPETRPFCGARCARLDLNRWLSGVYAIPVHEEEDEDGPAAQNLRGATEEEN